MTRILPLGDPARHFFMTRSVARVMGLSLSEEMKSGRLKPETYTAMVNACQTCALVEACESWLGRQAALSASPTPGCRNSAILTELARRQ
ncbi:DUF6455 family protein [Thetidibacter halocola]|uniref:DUF6455 domain-containing protein n=1 Tax=Thetidibacter halocola TaxID=2827239 RepID=A0A8J8B969_9RHOB|nr:DUF6455 family protein [Thetidibacter halocola]MBS0123888.1 hypothetical protein [Thetidibacter halocola]